MNYKLLDTEFTKSGFRFTQIKREGDIAIFHKVALAGAVHTKTFDAGFETVVITRHEDYVLGGVTIPAAEAYPGNEMWGTRGWSYGNLLGAELRFEKLMGRSAVEDALTTPAAPSVEDGETTVEEPTEKRTRRPKGQPLNLTVPAGEFTVTEMAEINNVNYVTAFLFVKTELDKSIRMLRTERRNGAKRPSNIYAKA